LAKLEAIVEAVIDVAVAIHTLVVALTTMKAEFGTVLPLRHLSRFL
jgi:hypothetical protein